MSISPQIVGTVAFSRTGTERAIWKNVGDLRKSGGMARVGSTESI